MDMEWEWRFQEILRQKRFRILIWVYVLILSLIYDLPENNENWDITPEFKNGPIIRFCLILL
jgi:hypothetical protein